MKAEEKMEGDRAFRLRGGYATLLAIFDQRSQMFKVSVRTNTVVHRVRWNPGKVEITAVGAQGPVKLFADRVLVTVPVGVLKTRPGGPGAIEFFPSLPQ